MRSLRAGLAFFGLNALIVVALLMFAVR